MGGGILNIDIVAKSVIPTPTGAGAQGFDAGRTSVDEFKVLHRSVAGNIDADLDAVTHL